MDIALISVILTSITAFAAVVGPIISSIISVRSNERTKRYEIYSPKVYAAVQRFTGAYAQFPRKKEYDDGNSYKRSTLVENANSAYKEFSAAAFEVMSLVPSQDIHNQIMSMLKDLDGANWVSSDHDLRFQALSAALASDLSKNLSPLKIRIPRKRNSKKRK